MKKLILILALLIVTFTLKAETHTRYFHGGVTFSFFYSSLSPYGEWVEIDYSLYAWRPLRVHYGWNPYASGRWIWTYYGWYWDSFEPFGWAVYHYGRWYYDDYYGWIWIPDYEWGPAWVEWRYTEDYVGWAPLPPYATFSISFGIRFSINWNSPHYCWNFIPYRYFCGYDVGKHLVGNRYKYRIYSNSKYRNDWGYDGGKIINRGVDRNFVERKSGSKIIERDVVETTRLRDLSGNRDRDRITIYRPGEDEISRTRVTDIEVKKLDRRTSLETSKIEIGRKERERIEIPNRENERKIFERESHSTNIKQNRNRDEIKIEERKRIEEPKFERPNYERDRNYNRNRDERKEEPKHVEPPTRIEKPKIETRHEEQKRMPEIEKRSEPRQEPKIERRNEPNRKETRSRDVIRENSPKRDDDSRSTARRR